MSFAPAQLQYANLAGSRKRAIRRPVVFSISLFIYLAIVLFRALDEESSWRYMFGLGWLRDLPMIQPIEIILGLLGIAGFIFSTGGRENADERGQPVRASLASLLIYIATIAMWAAVEIYGFNEWTYWEQERLYQNLVRPYHIKEIAAVLLVSGVISAITGLTKRGRSRRLAWIGILLWVSFGLWNLDALMIGAFDALVIRIY